jgi:hypothetical protein
MELMVYASFVKAAKSIESQLEKKAKIQLVHNQ